MASHSTLRCIVRRQISPGTRPTHFKHLNGRPRKWSSYECLDFAHRPSHPHNTIPPCAMHPCYTLDEFGLRGLDAKPQRKAALSIVSPMSRRPVGAAVVDADELEGGFCTDVPDPTMIRYVRGMSCMAQRMMHVLCTVWVWAGSCAAPTVASECEWPEFPLLSAAVQVGVDVVVKVLGTQGRHNILVRRLSVCACVWRVHDA